MAVSAVLRPAIAAREAPKSISVGLTRSIEQDVGGLDVAMQEARGVDLLQTVEQRPQDAVDSGRRQGAGLRQAALQRLALQELHDDVGRAVGLEEIEHPHDARRVLQAGERAALGDEAVAAPGEILCCRRRPRLDGGAVLAHGKRQRQVFLDGDLAPELGVAGAIGDAEAAVPQDR